MEERDRINDAINRVAPSVSPIGRNDPTALWTRDGFVYRETDFNQINEIRTMYAQKQQENNLEESTGIKHR